MNIMEQINWNISLALLLAESLTELAARVKVAKTIEERRAIALWYIGGDDGVKREATG